VPFNKNTGVLPGFINKTLFYTNPTNICIFKRCLLYMNRKSLRHSFSLLNVDHVHLNQTWNYKHVISPYYRLYYIDEGEGYISDKDQKLKLEPDYIYLIPSFTLCNMECPSYLGQYFIQFFEESPDGISLFQNNRMLMKLKASQPDTANFKRMLQINPGRGLNRSDNPTVYEKDVYYKEYQDLNNRQSDACYMETQGIILQLLARFLSTTPSSSSSTQHIPSKVLDAMSYIQLHLKQAITVSHLAKRANQHPDYFSREFLKYTGVRPLHYIHEKRVERAQYLITTTNMPYSEIALKTGFDNVPHFSKIFRKIAGMPPNGYRKQHLSVNMV
jgi:AraC-like DNA-binding protein